MLSRKEIHSLLLGILTDVDAFCKKEGLRYSLAYGTLIGAVRHKGFIPWDDDIDIMMPREDFRKFVDSYPSGRYRVLFYSEEKGHRFVNCFAKVEDTATESIEKRRRGVYEFGLNIDIFPIDNAPADKALHAGWMKECTRLKHRLYFRQKPLFAASPLPSLEAHLHSLDYWKEKMEECLNRFNSAPSPYAGPASGTTGTVEIFPKEVFENYTVLSFEGQEFYSIKDWDLFLRQQYGDYMQLPPPEKRLTHQLEVSLR
ncbi:MAG: LicD family protein [Bacteroidales bacterium]|nr:LicD family protein [Bacteroidales bacterium]